MWISRTLVLEIIPDSINKIYNYIQKVNLLFFKFFQPLLWEEKLWKPKRNTFRSCCLRQVSPFLILYSFLFVIWIRQDWLSDFVQCKSNLNVWYHFQKLFENLYWVSFASNKYRWKYNVVNVHLFHILWL